MIADSKSFQTPTKLVSKRAKIKVKMKQQQHDITAAWLAQLVERQSAVREVEGSSPRPDQHSGS